MNEWYTEYEGNTIRIENRWSSERLFINDKLHDEGIGLSSRSKLLGKLPDGRLVKACIGSGFWRLKCVIFVEDEVILRT